MQNAKKSFKSLGVLNLLLFLIVFLMGICTMFLAGFSVIQIWLIIPGLLLFIISFYFLYCSIRCFIAFGKQIGRAEAIKNYKHRTSTAFTP